MIKDKHKKIYIQTWGCQMNEYDTELVRSILAKENYAFTDNELDADIVMLNTCAIREHAHRKVYGRIHTLRFNRNKKPVTIGILGCMATNLRTELLENKNLDIDFIAGPDSYKKLPQLIKEAHLDEETEKPFDVTLSEFETYSDVIPKRIPGVNAWVAVMRGCNNFCSFCVVPYTRGRERSRSVENVLEEVRQLADEGFKQVTLLGQNVNSYKHDGSDFADLIEEVSKVKGIERIRFTSPHPKDFPDDLLDVIAKNPKVCKQIHMPLQAGSNRILDIMNRTYTQEEFLSLIDKARKKIPGVAFSTDIIVGFSSETDEEFEETLKVVRDVEFDIAFMFKYSERKNTIATRKFPDDVPDEVKKERITKLVELQKEITLKRYSMNIGNIVKVLIEKESTNKSKDHYLGRSDDNKVVIIPKGPYKQGEIVDVSVEVATPHVLRGPVVNYP